MTENKTISVIMTVHDQADWIEQNLPVFLTQQYPTAYEVIVVDDASTDDTPDALKRMRAEYSHLYTTFIPKSVPNPCRLRLALTIGAKAAHNDWVVLCDVTRPPQSDLWLQEIVHTVEANLAEVVMTYRGRKESAPDRYQAWGELAEAAPLLRKAERRTGRGHRGRWFKGCRGLYAAVAVPRRLVHETLKHYDDPVRGRRLQGLRLHVIWKNLLNRPHKAVNA